MNSKWIPSTFYCGSIEACVGHVVTRLLPSMPPHKVGPVLVVTKRYYKKQSPHKPLGWK